jgi:hypothetical protein
MKKTLITSILIFSIFNLTSCLKKGGNDPLISLMSRKARLCGEWKVSHEKYVESNSYDSNGPINSYFQKICIYDGESKTCVTNGSGTSIGAPDSTGNMFYTYSYSNVSAKPEYYTEEYVFKKDDFFKFTHINQDGTTITYDGKWKFLQKGEETKNKEKIQLIIINYSQTDINGIANHLLPQNLSEVIIIKIDRLKNNEVILMKNEYKSSTAGGPAGYSSGASSSTTTTLRKPN